MSFKRHEGTKYNHYITENLVLIGVDKTLEDEASLFVGTPMKMYDKDFYGKAMQLQHRDRNIVISSLEDWEIKRNSKATFNGLYWDILLDFISIIYGWNSYDIAKELDKYNVKKYYDSLEKMRSNKGNVRKEGKELINKICYYFKMTETIVETGIGKMYLTKDTEKYTFLAVNNYCEQCEKKDKSVNLKEMIIDITGIDQHDLIEIPLQIAVEKKTIDNSVYEFIEILMDRMKESRE